MTKHMFFAAIIVALAGDLVRPAGAKMRVFGFGMPDLFNTLNPAPKAS